MRCRLGIGSTALVTITDDDATGVTVTLGAASVSEDLTSVTVTATLNVAVQGGFTVLASTTDGSATAVSDYTAVTGHTLSFDGEATEEETFTVTIADDEVAEGVESFTVSLSGLSGNAVPVGIVSTALVTITDDDATGVAVTLGAASVSEDLTSVTVTATLNVAVQGGFTVLASTTDGSATAASDYTAVAGHTLSFDGEATEEETFTVTIADDEVAEGVESFTVSLSGLSGNAVPVGIVSTALVTITDDDATGVAVTLGAASVSEDLTSVTVTATLNVAVQGGFTVLASTTDGSATAGSDYTAVTGHMLSFDGDAGEEETFTVAILPDSIAEGDETFTVSLGGLSGTGVVVDTSSLATVTITDDDASGVTVTLGAAPVSESVVGGSVTVTATLNVAVQGGLTVQASTADGSATAGEDYTAVTGTSLSFDGDAGEEETFTVTILPDSIAEGDETFTVSLGGLSGTGVVVDTSSLATVTITDDDATGVTVTLGAASVSEDLTSVTVTATLNVAVQGGFTVLASTVDGSAIAGSDYTAVTGTLLTFAGGAGEEQTFPVTIVGDDVAEGEESFTVSLSGLSGNAVPVGLGSPATVTITDDDATGVTVTLGAASVSEDLTSVTVTATLNVAVQGGFTVLASTVAGSAIAGSDYTAVTGTLLTFAGGAGEEQTFPVTIVGDDVAEGEESFTVSLSGLSGNAVPVGLGSPATVTITDDDATGVTVTLGAASVSEDLTSVTVTATLNVAVQGGFTVLASTVAGSAIAGSDYTAVTGTLLTFAGGAGEEQTFPVTIVGDDVAEGEESFTVSLSGLSGNAVPVGLGSPATVTITDDDATGVTVTLGAASVSEDLTSVTVTATLNVAVQGGFTVLASTVAGSAIAGSDYTAVTGTLLTFAGGAGEEQTFPVTIVGDDVAEGEESFTVSLSGLSGNAVPVGLGSPATVTITDDDATGVTVTLGAASVSENLTSVTVTATLNVAVQGGFTVLASTVDGSAIAGSDYTAVTGTLLTFAGGAGEEQTFPVTIVGDDVAEGEESFTVSLSGLSGNAVPVGIVSTALVTITDDDATGVTVTLGAASVSENLTSVTVTATLNVAVQGGLTVQASTADGSATAGEDYTAVTGTSLSFDGDAGEEETFTVTILSDSIAEGDETFTVSLGGLSGTGVVVDTSSLATVTITDDDASGVTVTLGAAPVSESVVGGSVTVTARLNVAVEGGLTVQASTADGSATAGEDYTAVTGTSLSFDGDAGEEETFTVAILPDSIAEGDETFTVSLGGLSGTGVVVDTSSLATVTITDDDASGVAVTLGAAPVSESVVGGSVTVTATLNVAVQGGLTVQASTADGSATAGEDYTAVTGTSLSFDGDAGEEETFTVTILPDSIAEGDETFTVSLGGLSGTGVVVDTSFLTTVTITDDDATGVTVTLGNVSVGEGEGTVTVTARLNVVVEGGFTVLASTADDSATAGSDYTSVTGMLLTFAGTMGEEQMFPVTIEDDDVAEGEESFTVSLSGLSGNAVPVGLGSPATVTITDDDAAGVTLSATTLAVTEGEEQTYTVVLDTEPAGTVEVAVTLGSGPTAPITVTPLALSFSPTTWAAAQTVTVAAAEDDDALGGTRTLSHTVSGYGTVTSAASIVVTVTDNDSAPAAVILSAATVGEGDGTMTVTVTLDNAVQGGFTVTARTVDDTATAGSDYITSTAMMTFVGTAGETQMFPVVVIDDNLVEGDETFIVRLTGPGTLPDTIDITSTATVTILDDDTAPAELVLSLTPTRVAEDSGITTITVTAAYPGRVTLAAATEVTVSVAAGTASAADFTGVPDFTLTIAALSSSSTGSFDLTVTEDEETEDNETLTVSGAATGFAVISATLTVLGNNGALEVLVPELAHLSVRGVLDKVVGRIGQVVSGVAAPSARFAGHTSLALALAANEQVLNDGEMSWREVLGRSSFAVQLDDTDVAADGPSAAGNPASIWVSGNYDRASSQDDELGAWSGGLFTLHAGVDAGVDRLLSGEVLAGLSAFWSQGRFDFSENGSLYTKTLLAGLTPYIAWYSEDGSTLWATAGVGRGMSKQDAPGTEKDLAMRMLAIGGSRNIVDGTALEVDIKGDVSGGRLTADAADGLPAMTTDIHRLRLALEAVRVTVRDSGVQLVKSLALGIRHDGGDGETGFGAEFDGEMSWSNPASGVSLSIIGHTLLAHEKDLEEWGLGGLIRYAPTPGAGRGLSLQAEPVYGRPETDFGQIWEHRVTDLELAGDREPEARLAVDVSYGLPALTGRGLLTPYAGLELSEGGDRVYRLGGRFEAGSGIHIDLGGDRKEEDDERPEYGIHLAVRMHW